MADRGQGSSATSLIETRLFGYELLNDPLLNKGTAFTEEERDTFDLHGLLPPNVAHLDEQVDRRMQAFRQLPSDLARTSFCAGFRTATKLFSMPYWSAISRACCRWSTPLW